MESNNPFLGNAITTLGSRTQAKIVDGEMNVFKSYSPKKPKNSTIRPLS